MTRDPAGTEAMLTHAPVPGPAVPAVAEKAAAENFPVALRLLPRRYREHLMAIYVYARTVDDAGDEGPVEDRQRVLAGLAADLERLYGSSDTDGSDTDGCDGEGTDRGPLHPAISGLAGVVTDCQIPIRPFRDLIAANEQDQVVTRYETFDDLLSYCTLSANPVGQLVLYVFGASTPERLRLSDSVCSGLQVIEHLQDVGEDYRAGRIYLPAADRRAAGVAEEDLAAPSASPALRQLIAAEAAKAARLIDDGAPLVGQLRGAARVAVAGYLAGGRAALAALAAAGYDVLTATQKPGKGRTVRELAVTLVRGR